MTDIITTEKPKYASSTWYYNNYPSSKEKAKKWSKENIQRKREQDPETFNLKAREYMKNKYQTDEAYRNKQKAKALENYYKKKAQQQLH